MRARLSILILAAGLTFCAGLGRAAITDSDEAFYAEAAREMLASGDWLTPHYNFEVRFEKPVLYYWLAAATYRVAGVGEAQARVPAAASGIALVLLTWMCARRWHDEDSAFAAGLIVATNFGYFSIGRLALPDLPLAFFVTAATWAGFEAFAAADRGARRGETLWLAGAAAATALGFLTKGPVAIALPVLIWGTDWLVAPGRRRRLVLPRLHMRAILVATGVFAVLAVPWYAEMARVHGSSYLYRFFIGENLERFATERYNEPRPVWFYAPIVVGGLLPWSPFLLLWIPSLVAWARRRQPMGAAERRLAVWAIVPLVVFTLSVGKQPRYVLPVLPPIAMALARTMVARARAPGAAARPLRVAAVIAGVLLAAVGALLWRARPLLIFLSAGYGAVTVAVVLLTGAGLLLAAWRAPAARIPLAAALCSACTLLALQYAVFSESGPEPVQRVAAAIRQMPHPERRSGTYRVFVRNLVFYTATKQTNLRSPDDLDRFLRAGDPSLCVMSRDDVPAAEQRLNRRLAPVLEVPYFNPAGLRLRTLLGRRPERDAQAVALVARP